MRREAVLRPGSVVLAVGATALLVAGVAGPGVVVAVLAVLAAWAPPGRAATDESAE